MTSADTPDSRAVDPPRRGTGAAPAAAWAFGFLILRLFAVSGYDWSTAFAVSTTLSVNDGLALVFGSLMANHLVVSWLLILVVPLLIATYLWSPNGHRTVVVLPAALAVVVVVALTVSFASWWLPVSAVVLLAAFALVRRLPRHHRVRRAFARVLVRAGSITGVAVLLIAAFVQTPWVPQETIETTDATLIGYVLSVDSGYLNVLTDDHAFVILNSSDVLSRR